MVTESMVYWATRLDNIRVFLGIATFVLAGLIIFCGVLYIDNSDKHDEDCRKFGKQCRAFMVSLIAPLAFTVIGLVFVPTTAEYATIKIIPAIANSSAVQQLPKELEKFYPLVKDYVERKLKGENK